MSLTSANAGYVSNGIARFNFTGAHTGNGLQIDDAATQTGTAMAIGVNGLTTGRILSIIDSGTALTAATGSAGSLLNVNSTGYITGFTGNLASIQMSNASNAGNTGSLLYIADSGGVNLTKLLTMSSSSTTNTNALMSLTSATTAAISNGIVRFNFNAAHTANGFEIDDLTQTGKVMQVNASALTTGNAVNITANTLTTGQALLVSHTTSSVIADTGSLVRITSTMNDTGGATNGVLLDLSSTSSTAGTQFLQKYSALTTGIGQKIQTDVLTTGTALFITRAVGTAIASGGSLERISSAAIDTGSTNGVLLDLNSTASTAGTQFMQTYPVLATGIGQSIVANALTTGQALNISHSSGSNIADTGSLVRISSAGIDTGGATNGVLLDLSSTGSAAGTQFLQTYSALTTGIGQSIVANALGSGSMLNLASQAANGNFTGTFLNANLSGNNAGNTGTLIKVTVSGASSAAVPLMVTNLGTGLSLRVNDETGDTDTTPFVIDASGNVGIGNAAPGALLDLGLAGTKAGVMRLEGATAGYVAIQTTANVTAPWTMTLPATAGTAGQILQTDGSGTMTWTANNATGMTNPMTHAGDIIYASADGNPATPTALAKGNNGQCLLLSGGVPTWGSCGGASDTALSAITAATTSPSAIDSLNNVLTWNWSTLNTGTALTENFNGLTSGTAYNIASSSTGITTAGSNIGSLLNVATSGAITNFSGNLVNISMAGATNTNNTGALLNIVDQGATNEQTQLLAMRSFSTNEANTLM